MRKQTQFFKTHWKHEFTHGGTLRKSRKGRGSRPLSKKDPLHLVFKMNRGACAGLRKPVTHTLAHKVIRQYAKRFFVKIEQVSIQHDHIHLLIRFTQRSHVQHFFRVVAGQISQRVTGTLRKKRVMDFWKHRPFTRVIRGYRAYLIARDYVQLNEKEALNEIPYRKSRLRGLEPEEWAKLWGETS